MGRTNAIDNGFYIGGHNIFYDKWRFMNGDVYLGDVKKSLFEDYHCAAVIPGDNAIHGLLCNYRRRFLCLTTDPEADVLRAENHFISSAQTQVLDWLKARTNCLDRGMELASGSMDLLQQVLTGETGSFWVGLTKSRFIWEHTRKPIDHLTFRCGEPNHDKGGEHCVEMWLDGEYNDNMCSEPKPFVCEWDREPVNPSSTKPPFFTPKPSEHQEHGWMYAAIVGWVISFLSLSVHIYRKIPTPRKRQVDVNVETRAEAIATIELENQDDPTLDDLLSYELNRKLLNAVANGIYKNLQLGSATKLWAILEVHDVVDQVNKEQIQGNNNTKTNVEQVAALFEHLRRGTNRRYYYFRAALLKAGYDGVIRHYLDGIPGTPLSPAPVSPRPSSSSASAFPFPPTTPNLGKIEDGGEFQPSTSAAVVTSNQPGRTCYNNSVWSRFWQSLRHFFCPNRTSLKVEERLICEDTYITHM